MAAPPHHPAMQPPSYFMQQHPQASGMAQQAPPGGIFPPRGPLQFGSPHQLQDPQQQQHMHQQAMHGHMGMRPMGINNNNNNGMQHQMQQPPETSLGGTAANGNPLQLFVTFPSDGYLFAYYFVASCSFLT